MIFLSWDRQGQFYLKQKSRFLWLKRDFYNLFACDGHGEFSMANHCLEELAHAEFQASWFAFPVIILHKRDAVSYA